MPGRGVRLPAGADRDADADAIGDGDANGTAARPLPVLLDRPPLEGMPAVPTDLQLTDRYGAATVFVGRPKRLCNPADKNGEDPEAPFDAVHLLAYEIAQTAPVFIRHRDQQVENQFGTLTVEVLRPDLLLVPTAKSLTAPPAPLETPGVDHFKCYRVGRVRTRITGVRVEDQFGTLLLNLMKPVQLCVPAGVGTRRWWRQRHS